MENKWKECVDEEGSEEACEKKFKGMMEKEMKGGKKDGEKDGKKGKKDLVKKPEGKGGDKPEKPEMSDEDKDAFMTAMEACEDNKECMEQVMFDTCVAMDGETEQSCGKHKEEMEA